LKNRERQQHEKQKRLEKQKEKEKPKEQEKKKEKNKAGKDKPVVPSRAPTAGSIPVPGFLSRSHGGQSESSCSASSSAFNPAYASAPASETHGEVVPADMSGLGMPVRGPSLSMPPMLGGNAGHNMGIGHPPFPCNANRPVGIGTIADSPCMAQAYRDMQPCPPMVGPMWGTVGAGLSHLSSQSSSCVGRASSLMPPPGRWSGSDTEALIQMSAQPQQTWPAPPYAPYCATAPQDITNDPNYIAPRYHMGAAPPEQPQLAGGANAGSNYTSVLDQLQYFAMSL